MKTEFSQFDSAEPHLVFFKDSERRAQRQMKTGFSQFDSAEPHLVFFKDSERRAQRQMKTGFSQFDSAEPHPVFFKDSERRAQRQMKTEFSQFDSAEPYPVFFKDRKKSEKQDKKRRHIDVLSLGDVCGKSKTPSNLRSTGFQCPGQESNLHALRHTHLKRARLPIPPPGPFGFVVAKVMLYSVSANFFAEKFYLLMNLY